MNEYDREAKWIVRNIDECPRETMEGIEMIRVLEGTRFDRVGCEYVILKAGQSLDEHVHKQASSFILVIDGTGIVTLDGKKITIGRRDTVFVPAGVFHGFYALEEDLTLYGFQSPPIIRDADDVDIFFREDGRQGRIYPGVS